MGTEKYLVKNDRYEKLADYIYKSQKKIFKYGDMDCAIFTVGAVDAQLGTKLNSKLFGKYKDLKSGIHKIKEIAKGGYLKAIQKICKDNKFKEISPGYAQRGDVCMMKDNGKTIMGVIGLNNKPIFITKELGIIELENNVIQKVWRIS